MTNVSTLIFIGALTLSGIVAILLIVALVHIRRRGGKDVSKSEMQNPGEIASVFKWTALFSLIITVLSLFALFTIQSIVFAWMSVAFLVLFLISGPIYRLLLLAGK